MICFSHDHLGHGLSEGERATVPNIEWFVDDVIQHVAKVTVGSYRIPFIPNIGNAISANITRKIFSDEASISKAAFLYFWTFYGRFDSTKVREDVILRKVKSPTYINVKEKVLPSIPPIYFKPEQNVPFCNRAIQRNPRLFEGVVLMGPLVKPIEEVTMSQYIAARITSLFTPKYEAASFPLVRKRHLRMTKR